MLGAHQIHILYIQLSLDVLCDMLWFALTKHNMYITVSLDVSRDMLRFALKHKHKMYLQPLTLIN